MDWLRSGRLLFQMLAVIGEFERNQIKERAADVRS